MAFGVYGEDDPDHHYSSPGTTCRPTATIAATNMTGECTGASAITFSHLDPPSQVVQDIRPCCRNTWVSITML